MALEQHPSAVQLLNHCQELPIDEALRQHIDRCPSCQERLRALRQERADFAPAASAERRLDEFLERLEQTRPPPRRFLRPWMWAPVGAALLLVVGFLFGPDVFKTSASSGAHFKGAITVRVYVKRAEQSFPVDGDFLFRPGDRIRLGILAPKPVFVTLMAKLPTGLAPIPDLTEVAVGEGQEVVLPGSLVLGCEDGSESLQLRVASGKGSAAFDQRTMVLRCERP